MCMYSKEGMSCNVHVLEGNVCVHVHVHIHVHVHVHVYLHVQVRSGLLDSCCIIFCKAGAQKRFSRTING